MSPLAAAAAIAAAALALLVLLGTIVAGAPFTFDRDLLLALRGPDGVTPMGPRWLARSVVDLTALGDGTILTLVVVAVALLLLIRRHPRAAVLVVAATWSGSFVVSEAKRQFARARPDVVDHLVEVASMSFPSGHAANSATIYLTLAALGGQVTRDAATRRFLMIGALLLVAAIGASRVYLGVHWPSDVLAGWAFGGLWALAWWLGSGAARASLVRQG